MKKIGIIGSGAMGTGIAQVFAAAGCEVVLYDRDPEALERAAKRLEAAIDKLLAQGTHDSAQVQAFRQLVSYTRTPDTFADRDLVLEAIVEDPDIKRETFARMEEIVSPDCVLASNTSSLSLTAIASACKNPERVLGIHFFNPAPRMPLVEVIPAVQTREGLAEEMLGWITSIGKQAVLAKDTPGFIVNRIARPFYGEAIRIYEEGMAGPATIDHALRSLGGFRMGPFELMDFIGHDVNYRVTESVYEAFFYDPRYKPSFTQKRLLEAGYLGRKTGRGFYVYHENAREEVDPEGDATLWEQIFNRVLCMLINEAADALYLGVASRDDIDLAMTKGVNYPKGLLRWADEYGIERIRTEMDGLSDFYKEDRYRLSPLLRRMAASGERFYI